MTQTASGITGSGTLLGDVDCMDATAEGSLGADNIVAGLLTRPPCPHNEWAMTALNLLERTTSGTWTKPASGGAGTFTGTQIAKSGGPRIRFLNPPGGPPGTIVTIAGTGFSPAAADNDLDFNGTPATDLLKTDATTIVARVPDDASIGHIYLTNSTGTALSPRAFNLTAGFPTPSASATISVQAAPEGIVISPDGRKAYAANRTGRSVSIINTATNSVITTTVVDAAQPVQGIVASPDGKRVYAANGTSGIRVLDAAILSVLDTIPVNAGGAATVNPQGLAMSPDGRLLYVSDNRDAGTVTVLDIATKTAIATYTPGAGSIPLGIAPSPDGTRAYIAVSGPNELRVFDPFSESVIAAVPVGSGPAGVAVTPDGGKVYVSNALGNSISIYDTATGQVTTQQIGSSPTGLAISPDGSRLYIANRANSTVSVVSTASDQTIGSAINVGSSPTGIAMSADGKRAYVTNANGGSVSEIGGPLTLTITKAGTGMGTVTSAPEGILCGSNCQARYEYGTSVALTAVADGGSYFSGWSTGCASNVVMNSNKTCTATFTRYYSGSGGGGSSDYYYGGCYIATAAFGSSVDPHVKVLADLHDKYFTGRAGRAVTRAYHRYAPVAADYISRHRALRMGVRAALLPLVYAVQEPTGALGVLLLLAAAARTARRKWAERLLAMRDPGVHP